MFVIYTNISFCSIFIKKAEKIIEHFADLSEFQCLRACNWWSSWWTWLSNVMWRQIRRLATNAPKQKHDLIGQPCPKSLLRPVKLAIPPNETTLQWQYRLRRLEVHRWNEKFWTAHNNAFHRVCTKLHT